MTKPPKIDHSRGFEKLVAMSGRGDVELQQLPGTGGRFIGKGRFCKQPICCDFVGTIMNSGRAIYFDAKTSGEERRLDLKNACFKERVHQKDFLVRMHKAGAMAGLLVECRSRIMFYWISAKHFDQPSMLWGSPEMIPCGAAGGFIHFPAIIYPPLPPVPTTLS